LQGQSFCERLEAFGFRAVPFPAAPCNLASAIAAPRLASGGTRRNTPKNISGCQETLLRFTGGVERTVRFGFH